MGEEKGLKTIRLNNREPFDILYQNPGGARYYQDGKFYGVGKCYLKDQSSVKLSMLPLSVQDKIRRGGGLKPYPDKMIADKEELQEYLEPEEKVVIGKEEEYQCPHCDKSYKDKQWYDKHLATHESD